MGKPQETLGHILVQVGFIGSLFLHDCFCSWKPSLYALIQHFLQLTATLRNLAEVTSKRTEFISDRVLEELCGVMDMYFNDGDLMLNVVRIYR